MDKAVKVFIVEGIDRDYRFLGEMAQCFFQGKFDAHIIRLPAEMNLYMLYSLLKKDEFETDVIEILREQSETISRELQNITRQQIDEVFLFFDYDAHQNNLPQNVNADDVISELFSVFDNETENGKLYISYPMIEALYDAVDFECRSFTNCFVPVEKFNEYKKMSGNNNPLAGKTFKINEWRTFLGIFGLRLSCLFEKTIEYSDYLKINSAIIYHEQQRVFMDTNKIFVLSALPEFIYDYFGLKFWRVYNTHRRMKYKICPKNNIL